MMDCNSCICSICKDAIECNMCGNCDSEHSYPCGSCVNFKEDLTGTIQGDFEELGRATRKLKEHLIEAMKPLVEAVQKAAREIVENPQPIIDWLDRLEPYQKYEILHPRKKPRGSIRRNRKRYRK